MRKAIAGITLGLAACCLAIGTATEASARNISHPGLPGLEFESIVMTEAELRGAEAFFNSPGVRIPDHVRRSLSEQINAAIRDRDYLPSAGQAIPAPLHLELSAPGLSAADLPSFYAPDHPFGAAAEASASALPFPLFPSFYPAGDFGIAISPVPSPPISGGLFPGAELPPMSFSASAFFPVANNFAFQNGFIPGADALGAQSPMTSLTPTQTTMGPPPPRRDRAKKRPADGSATDESPAKRARKNVEAKAPATQRQYTIGEVVQLTGIDRTTLTKWLEEKLVHGFNDNGVWLIWENTVRKLQEDANRGGTLEHAPLAASSYRETAQEDISSAGVGDAQVDAMEFVEADGAQEPPLEDEKANENPTVKDSLDADAEKDPTDV